MGGVEVRAPTPNPKPTALRPHRPQIPAGDLLKLERLARDLEKTIQDGEAKLTGDGLRGPLPFTTAQIEAKVEAIKDLSDALKLIKPKAQAEGKEL